MSGRGMSTAADLTSLEFDESFDAFDSLDSDFDLAWSPQNSDLPALGASGHTLRRPVFALQLSRNFTRRVLG